VNKLRFAVFALAACTGCASDPTAPPGTLLLLDGHGATVTAGRITLTAYSQSSAFNTPEPIGTGPGIGVSLDVRKNPPDSTLSTFIVACIDLRLYTAPNGGTLAYSQNAALQLECHAMGGGSSGPNGVTSEGIGVDGMLHDADVVPMIPRGTYYIRWRVTFPDSSVAEVIAGSLARG
jgi:hypothetical protein